MKLRELATVIRSKNAGPFELTLDVMFPDEDAFERAKRTLTKELIERLYEREVLSVYWYAPALAFKATVPRTVSAGAPGDTDVFGAQQHAPLLDIEV